MIEGNSDGQAAWAASVWLESNIMFGDYWGNSSRWFSLSNRRLFVFCVLMSRGFVITKDCSRKLAEHGRCPSPENEVGRLHLIPILGS